jgi:hypothetical protein
VTGGHIPFTRWSYVGIKGAYGPSGGHVKALGITYLWNTNSFAGGTATWHLGFWGLLHFCNRGDGLQWAVCSFSMTPAGNRIGVREREARNRRDIERMKVLA